MPLPETEVPGALQTALVSRGIRMTRQRRIILEIIETRPSISMPLKSCARPPEWIPTSTASPSIALWVC